MKILFISPHPDDIEFAAGNTEIQLVQDGHEVYMLLSTADEYGTDRDDFKGERISKIRRNEMKRAAKITGIKKIVWLGFIDGYMKISKKNMSHIENKIKKIDPDIIFSPDPFHPVDLHPDHLRTGFMVLSILKKWKKRPITLLYYTFSPNFYIPDKSWKQTIRAFSQHKSQFFDSKFVILFNRLFHLIYGFNLRNSRYADAYRIINFDKPLKKNTLFNNIKYSIFYLLMKIALPTPKLYKPTPTELGIKEFRDLD